MRTYIIFILLIFSSLTMGENIRNFKAGVMCTDAKSFGWVCHDSTKIFITGQGQCNFNKELVPCTWHGFEFEYTGFTKDTVFECTSTSSEIAITGNPETITEENSTTTTYKLTIPEGDGWFINPQYKVLSTPKNETNIFYEHTVCSLNGMEKVEFKNEFIFPANPNP